MTKAEEIDAWQRFAAAMPPATTYSGRWIKEQIDHIAADIAADFPAGTRAASMAEAEEMRAAAMAEAVAIRENARTRANAEAKRIMTAARQKADRTVALALHALREAARTLEA